MPSRSGSLIILFLAIIVLVAVMAFGLLDYTSTLRQAARSAHQDALMRTGMLAGRALAISALEQSYHANNTDNGRTHLGESWATSFAPTAAWPSIDTHPDNAVANPAEPGSARRLAREALAAATSAWTRDNAVDLWRGQPGLSSPVSPTGSAVHAHDRGYTSSPGVGRWFTVAYYDRSMNQVTSSAQAAYALRCSVNIIDQSGLLLGNKARYQHLVQNPTTPISIREGYLAATAAAPTLNGYVLTDGVACEITDAALGPTQDAAIGPIGVGRHRYNTWRPIPADHGFLAHYLLTFGLEADDSLPGTYSDDTAPVNETDAGSLGDTAASGGGTQTNVYYRRVPKSLPDIYRAQGYYRITHNFPQWSSRFDDFYPFEMNPWAPGNQASTSHMLTPRDATFHGSNRNNEGVVYEPNPSASARAYPTVYPGSQGYRRAGNDSVFNGYQRISGSGTEAYQRDRLFEEIIRNRHMAHLVALSRSTGHTGSRVNRMMWARSDFINWGGIAQSIRVNQSIWANDNNFGVRPASEADAKVQLLTPFGSPIGFFDRSRNRSTLTIDQNWAGDSTMTVVIGPTKTSNSMLAAPNLAKNQWEMRTQWAVNINTAPRKVLEALMKLVIVDTPNGGTTASAETAAPSGSVTNAYEDCVAAMARALEISRNTTPFVPEDMVWRNNALAGAWVAAANAAGYAFGTGSVRTRAVRSLQSLIHGGYTGQGPMSEFEVLSFDFVPNQPLNGRVVLRGLHRNRFHVAGEDADALSPNVEYRLWFANHPNILTFNEISGTADVQDVRKIPAMSATQSRAASPANGRRIHAPFRVKWISNTSPAHVTFDAGANTTTIIFDLARGNGYADYSDWEEIVNNWQAGTTIAYIDYTTVRRRELPDQPWPTLDQKGNAWQLMGPGLSFVAGRSRHYRIAVRAQLQDMDLASGTRERAWDMVYHIDPDRSGLSTGNGFWDTFPLYSDWENPRSVTIGGNGTTMSR